jgi:XTP/dITP diphosphohydrolase
MNRMRAIYFATTNRAKVMSAERMLAGHNVRIVHVRTSIEEPEHTNDSREIAKAKCIAALVKVPGPVMCEDGGFFVRAMGWKPGVSLHSYLATPNALAMKGADKLLYDIRESADRYAYSLNVLAYMEAGWKEPVYFESKVEGEITKELRGEQRERNWSPVDLVFVPSGYTKTLAEMSDAECEIFSEKVSAFKKLSEYLSGKQKISF